MTEHPADEGHTFKITFTSRGSSKVVGDEHYQDSDWWSDERTVEVRAWNLRNALLRASGLPLSAWFPDEEDGPIDTRLNQERVQAKEER